MPSGKEDEEYFLMTFVSVKSLYSLCSVNVSRLNILSFLILTQRGGGSVCETSPLCQSKCFITEVKQVLSRFIFIKWGVTVF